MGVWFTNEFDGARLNDVVRVSPFVYELTISAENTPINNSAWVWDLLWLAASAMDARLGC